MLSLLGPWLAFPLVLCALCVGTGLLVERLAGRQLPTVLLAPLGYCGLVAALVCVTAVPAIAAASPWVALLLGVAGWALGWRRLRAAGRDWWAIGLPVVISGLMGATAVLTGQRTFLGYTSLGDAAFNFGLADWVVGHGRSLTGLEPSSYQQTLANYFGTAYPVGSHTVLGATSKLLGLDVAWTYQPYLAALPALFALSLVPLAREVLERRAATVAAGMAAGGGMVFAYAVLQQAIKELATLVVLGTLVAVTAWLVRERPGPRVAIPLAVVAGAGLGVLSLALVPWAGPVLLAGLVLVVVRWGRSAGRALLAMVAVFAVVGLVLALPTLELVRTFVAVTNTSLTGAAELGNLSAPIPFGNAFGVWPAEDYRLGSTPAEWGAIALVGNAVVLGFIGLVAAVRQRAVGLTLFWVVSLVGFLVVAGRASPWAYGKALLLFSPALVLAAAVGVGALRRGHKVEAVVLGTALLGGLLWTDAISYHNADPAPNARLAELERIGERFAGQGPLTTFEFEEFGKYFLREAEPNALTESINRGDIALAPGRGVRFGVSSEPDDWSGVDLAKYPLLVVRRGPVQSRPPSNFRRVFRGRFYSVWRRDDSRPVPSVHVPLGGRLDAAARPKCSEVRELARQAREAGGRLAFAVRAPAAAFDVSRAALPANWGVDVTDPATLRPVGQGRVEGFLRVRAPGVYTVWAEGSFGRRETIRVDGRVVGAVGPALSPRLGGERAGTVRLRAGRHQVSLFIGGGDLRPGNGGTNRLVGPVTLVRGTDVDASRVVTVAPREFRRACGRRLDWLEVLPG